MLRIVLSAHEVIMAHCHQSQPGAQTLEARDSQIISLDCSNACCHQVRATEDQAQMVSMRVGKQRFGWRTGIVTPRQLARGRRCGPGWPRAPEWADNSGGLVRTNRGVPSDVGRAVLHVAFTILGVLFHLEHKSQIKKPCEKAGHCEIPVAVFNLPCKSIILFARKKFLGQCRWFGLKNCSQFTA